MSVLVAWPTVDVDEANETAKVWKAMGYDTAVLVEEEIELPSAIDSYIKIDVWQGFPAAANELCLHYGGIYDIIVIGGNDLYPDQSKSAHEIEEEFRRHFNGTFGLMHPTGDRYGSIDIVAVCPWIGAAYIDRVYGGQGPYCDEYYHYFCDAELQDVAIKHNAFWQRPDLSQYHDHWGRNQDQRPTHLIKAKDHHPEDQRTYNRRKAEGFPGSEL